ncbi:MAG: PIG-L family deacetylase [Thermoanaerobaculia bacterium]
MSSGAYAIERRLYLSPHLDDAVLSCGGQIARAARATATVDILTIFAGDEPDPANPSASPLVDQVFALWGLPAGEVMSTRRREDAAACRLLQARCEQWKLQEAIHRRDPATGEALYTSLKALFGDVSPQEEPLIAGLARRLADLAPDDSTRVFAPLGIGGHVDHRIVRQAAERAFGSRLCYYEEFPYIVWKLFARRRAGVSKRQFEALRQALSAEDVAARIAAIACYASQVPSLFSTRKNLARQVHKHVRRARGERVWRRRRPDGPVS